MMTTNVQEITFYIFYFNNDKTKRYQTLKFKLNMFNHPENVK